jgi:cadmium resistance protein CadD (predicted permease)
MEKQRVPGILGIAMKYGLIQGVLSFVVFLVQTLAGISQGWIRTVASVAILVVLMVLAHLEFRRTHHSEITYGQGLGSGTLLVIVAALLTSALTYVYVEFINTGYIAAATHARQAALAQRGLTGAQVQQAMAITGLFMSPVGIAISYMISGVIVGFIVALIVSFFTQNDPSAV